MKRQDFYFDLPFGHSPGTAAAGIAANRQLYRLLRRRFAMHSVFAGGCYSAAIGQCRLWTPCRLLFQEKPLIRRFYSAGFMIGIRPLCFFLRRV